MAEVREWIKSQQKPLLSTLKGKMADYYIYRQQFEQLSLAEDEVLTIKRSLGPNSLGEIKLVLPVSLYDQAFYFAHTHPSAGHFGVTATLERLRKHVGLVRLLLLIIKFSCAMCVGTKLTVAA